MEADLEKGNERMTSFSDLQTAKEVIEYQKKVLSRTGGRTAENACIYHYTNITSLTKMLDSRYMWLSPPDKMNDYLEYELLQAAGLSDLYFSCFSRTNQNIAMFKMYASNPNGAMLSMSVADAKKMLAQKPRLVDGIDLKDEVDADLYWIGVCYKNLETDTISTPGQMNRNIKKPLKELSGAVKLSGWEYEKEVRLCGRKSLSDGQRLAVKLPDKLGVVLCPGFDRDKYRKELSYLKANGIDYELSQYDNWVRL